MILEPEIKDGRMWLTITAQSLDEWRELESLFWKMTDGDTILDMNIPARQMSLRIDKPRNRLEREEYYYDH